MYYIRFHQTGQPIPVLVIRRSNFTREVTVGTNQMDDGTYREFTVPADELFETQNPESLGLMPVVVTTESLGVRSSPLQQQPNYSRIPTLIQRNIQNKRGNWENPEVR